MKEGASDPFEDFENTESTETTTDTTTPSESGGTVSVDDLPYILRRDTVREDRSQIPFFFRDWVVDQEEEFIDELEQQLGVENLPKADIREAAQIFAHRHPEDVADVLREFGYDLK